MFKFLIFAQFFSPIFGAICYTCFGNSTDAGSFCSIDKLCTGTSCFFDYKSDKSWSAGCSTDLASSANITCASSGSCSCNSDFCNSIKQAKVSLATVMTTATWNLWDKRTSTTPISLHLPNRTLVYCEECGTVTVGNATVDIPCDHDHTCQGNYCVSVRGQSPYSYCGGVWDEERESACYHNNTEPERCYCTMNMCNFLLDPAPIYTTTTSAIADATLAPMNLANEDAENDAQAVTTTATETKTTTKKKCTSSNKLSPNDLALTAGDKLKNVILSGFGTEDDTLETENCTDDEE